MLMSSSKHCRLHKTVTVIAAMVLATLLSTDLTWAAATNAPAMHPAAELKIYKQTLRLTADIRCSLYEKRAKQCTADVSQTIGELIAPEMILRYTHVRIGEEEFEPDAGTTVFLQFRPRDVNYTGQQTLELELLYIK